ncbi:hypothetical protein L249_6261 [Ophiocordyceps polyrhachis-furcata BCC 54312]|uniref:Chromo domain-containing protein n=1 Tax=Ophiocordyceps polyrhachis-furcata BCC 54312 TaxID=1330021 RepID=A0A367L158_9HYPO|nr:hypothetical protein L249_6261 [Ophiocordyceps polyrhachis-furcata BCC 54312]
MPTKPSSAGSVSALRSASRASRRSVASVAGQRASHHLMKPRAKTPKTTTNKAKNEWYSIRGILRERKAKGRVEYLVDWEDDGVTGQRHDPTWTPSCDVTDAARRDWEANKAVQKKQPGDESKPPKRKRANAGHQGAEGRPHKVPKLSHSATPSEEPVFPLKADHQSLTPQAASAPTLRRLRTLVVEIAQTPLFDPSGFVSYSDSELTGAAPSQSLPKVEDDGDGDDNQTETKSVVATRESGQTIPDSQEPSGQTGLSAARSLATPRQGPSPSPDSHLADPETRQSSSPAAENRPHQLASPHRQSIDQESLPDYETPAPEARDPTELAASPSPDPERYPSRSPDYHLHQFASWSQLAYRPESPYSPLSPGAAEAAADQLSGSFESPIFASQLSPRHTFALPETSSSGNLIPATQTDSATQTDGVFFAYEQDEEEDVEQDDQTDVSIKSEDQDDEYSFVDFERAGHHSLGYYADNVLPSVESDDFVDATGNQEPHDSGAESTDAHHGSRGAGSSDYSTESPDRPVEEVNCDSPDYRPDDFEFGSAEYQPEPVAVAFPEEEEDFVSEDESLEREFAQIIARRRQAEAEAEAEAEAAAALSTDAQVDHASQHGQVDNGSQRAQFDHASQDAQVVAREHLRSQRSTFSTDSGTGHMSPAIPIPPPAAPAAPDTSSMADESQDPPPANQELGTHQEQEARCAIPPAPRKESERIIQNRQRVMQNVQNLMKLHSGPSAPPIKPSPIGTKVQNMFKDRFPNTPSRPMVASSAQDATVSPADISKPLPEPTPATWTSNTIGSSSSQATPQMGQGLPEQSSSHDSADAVIEPCQGEHVITLPFQASQRPYYDESLVKSKRVVNELNTIFSNEVWVEPTDSLVHQVDELLALLFNACDFPPDIVASLADLPASQKAKYSCDANAKFNFVFELLQGARKDTKILIIARSVALLRLLSHLTEVLELDCACEAIGQSATSAARVTLALPSDDMNGTNFDVIIGFDHSYPTWRASSSLLSSAAKKPLTLHLVTTHSIEHISLHVPANLGPVEHKNALLSSVVRARQLISDPERGYLEPHEIAGKFVAYINNTASAIAYEPVPLPDDVAHIFRTQGDEEISDSSSSPTDGDGRKRKHVRLQCRPCGHDELTVEIQDGTAENAEGETAGDARAKRPRLLPNHGANQPPLPDEVQSLLRKMGVATDTSSGRPGDVQVNVTLSSLQTLAEKFAENERRATANDAEAEYKAVISRLEKQVKEYERSMDQIYKSNRKALEDRSRFEDEKLKAEAALEDEKSRAEAALGRKETKIAELEAVVERLTSNPNGNEETPLAKTNRLLEEANGKEKQLQKRLQNAQQDMNYVKDRYQEASTSAAAAQEENSKLRAQTDILKRKASENVVKVHRMQLESDTRVLAQEASGLRAQLKERDWEMERLREEVRKNGRRETRQASLPRSPHAAGIMSPHLQARANGVGSGSRGTSPSVGTGHLDGAGGAPSGAQFTGGQPGGNGRWSHLRD